MLKCAYKWRNVLNAVANSTRELIERVVCEGEWENAKKIADFLETAGSITENQSGSLYVTLSVVCVFGSGRGRPVSLVRVLVGPEIY